MSIAGKTVEAKLNAKGLRVAIIGARWNSQLVYQMMQCAAAEAQRCGVAEGDITSVHVDGSGELAQAAQILARSGKFDAIAAFGVIVRGGTPHFETVMQRATEGLMRVALDEGVPIADGVVAVYDLGQAELRSGAPGSHEDKGAGAMHAALDLAILRRKYQV